MLEENMKRHLLIILVIIMLILCVATFAGCSGLEGLFSKKLKAEIAADDKYRKEVEDSLIEKNPNDIVVPADATDEERQQLEDEKLYWTIVKTIKQKADEFVAQYIKNKPDNLKLGEAIAYYKKITNVRAIYSLQKNISEDDFIDEYKEEENGLVIDCDIMYEYWDVFDSQKHWFLREGEMFFKVTNKSISSKVDNMYKLLTFLQHEDTHFDFTPAGIKNVADRHSEDLSQYINAIYENYMKSLFTRKFNGDSRLVRIIGTSVESAYPQFFTLVMAGQKYVEDKEETYVVYSYSVYVSEDMSLERWKEFALLNNADATTSVMSLKLLTFYALGFDWTVFAQKYPQRAK